MTSRRSRARQSKSLRTSTSVSSRLQRLVTSHPTIAGLTVGAGALIVAALTNGRLAAQAERANPPGGKFVEVDGVRLHYIEHGSGEPLVLLHGNGSMIQDFVSSGLVDIAADKYRVIAFDRPGFGHSDRPRTTIWTADAQAALIEAALTKLGISKATVLGHSWGCSVAVSLGLRAPELVSGLVLASGYYFPTIRVDVATMSGPAVPVVGDAIRYSVSPILARLMWPLMKSKLFGPAPVPGKFEEGFPKEMTFRPSQIRASAAESALMIPGAFATCARYADLKMPVAIVAGEEDRLIDIDDQSARLHAELPNSTFHRVPGAGHMVHQTVPEVVMNAITEASSGPRGPGKVVPLAA
jgi:pimeloyl-ACP methyl ester carboxylesterase